MKDVIRSSVFETNSSSEHSLILMKDSDYKAWIGGNAMARLCKRQESDNTYGNFWSTKLELEFTNDIEAAQKENLSIAINHAKAQIEALEVYRKKLVNFKPTDEDLSDEDMFDLRLRWSNVDEDWYNRQMKHYTDILNSGDQISHFGCYDRFDNGMWITYDEFWKAFTEESDCYSPFEHDDKQLNVHVIGKYFHS